jgi:secreted PhoX family phosphatase
MSEDRRLLPVIRAAGHSGRSEMTCVYRCGNACSHPVPNQSENEYFGDLVIAEVSRRQVMRAGAAGSLVLGAETCGPIVTFHGKSVFAAVQHPGEISGATVENPASTWPDGDFAKPAVVCAWRLDGADAGR